MYGPIEMTYKIVYMPASSANVYMIFIESARRFRPSKHNFLKTKFFRLSEVILDDLFNQFWKF